MGIAVLGGTSGVAASASNNSKFGTNVFGAGNSPTCQPGNGKGDNGVNHVHLGPPGQNDNLSAQQIHQLDLQNNKLNNGNCVPSTPKPPSPPTPPKPPGPVPIVPGHGQVSPTAAVTPSEAAQQLAAVQQQVAGQQVQQATPATPVTTTAHFTG